MSPLTLNWIRQQGEAFSEAISREYYLAGSGQKPTADLQGIYARHADVIGPDALALATEAFRGAQAGSEEWRQLRLLFFPVRCPTLVKRNARSHSTN